MVSVNKDKRLYCITIIIVIQCLFGFASAQFMSYRLKMRNDRAAKKLLKEIMELDLSASNQRAIERHDPLNILDSSKLSISNQQMQGRGMGSMRVYDEEPDCSIDKNSLIYISCCTRSLPWSSKATCAKFASLSGQREMLLSDKSQDLMDLRFRFENLFDQLSLRPNLSKASFRDLRKLRKILNSIS